MDPVSVIGLIASLAQLIDVASKTLRFLNNIKNAPKDRAQVAQEASLLLALLTSLRYRLEEADAQDCWVQGVLTLGMANGPLDQFKDALESLATRLHSSGTGKSVGKVLAWHFERKEIDELLGKMERLKSYIHLALEGDILNITKSVKSDTVVIPGLQTNVLAVKANLELLQAGEIARNHTTMSVKVDTAGIPVLHTNILTVKNGMERLQAEELARDHTTKSVKTDTALIPVLQSDVLEVKDEMEKLREAELVISENLKREKVLAWISKGNARETYRRKLQERQPGTGSWFLKSKPFQEWLVGDGETLWCPGIPGAGKTILACVAMNELEQKFEVDANSTAACVFCDYKDVAATKPINLISDLLSQTLGRQKSLPKNLSELYEKQEKLAAKPSLKDINDIFHELAKTQKIYLIVDALDECPNEDDSRNVLLQHLSHLRGTCNILLTSRSSVSISEYFDNHLTITITANESDIDKYIADHMSSRLQRHIKQKPSLYEEIRSVIKKRAQNMFLLVKLHMESLASKQTPNAVLKALQTLPNGVFETYKDILQRIEDQSEDDRQLAKKTLMWLSLSLRPMTMKELQHAVTVDESFDELDEDDIPNEEIIVSVCAGLVSLAAEEGVVQLVHFTAQEYFSQESVRETLFFEGQRRMLSSCLAYLLLDDFEDGLPEVEKGPKLDSFITKHPFFYYAAHNWGHHARAARLYQTDQEMILRLLENEPRVVSLTDALHIAQGGPNRRFYPGLFVEIDKQGLWLASYFGLLDTANHILENGVSANTLISLEGSVPNSRRISYSFGRDRSVNSNRAALTVAAWNGHVSVVRLLLDKGAKIQDLDLNGAVYNQHLEIVDLLLRHGASLDNTDEHGPFYYGSASKHMSSFSQSSKGYAPIHWCAQSGNVEMTRLLVANGANVHIKTTYHNTPLILAARNGHLSIIRLLLEFNAEVNAQNAFKETAMHEACKIKSTGIIKLLLDKGASFTIPDADEYERWKFESDHATTSLVYPFYRRHTSTWDLDLAEYKISGGNTAFEYGLKHEQNDILQLFLDADCSSVLSGKAPVPLLFAAYKNNIQMLELLLRYGADVNAKDQIGRTALFWAAANNSEAMTMMLLAKAPEIDACTADGTTPLHMAAESSSPNVLKQLIEHGACMSSKRKSAEKSSNYWNRMSRIGELTNCDGRTPLHQAVSRGCFFNVQLLIEAGADIIAKDDEGRTPFYLATECYTGATKDSAYLEFLPSTSKLREDAWLIAQLLLCPASVNTCDNHGRTPLMSAAKNWDWELVQLLLMENAEISTIDESGQGAVHTVFIGGPRPYHSRNFREDDARAVLEILRLHGADFNKRDTEGNSPLFSAVQSHLDNLIEFLDLLLEFGADISSTNNTGASLLHYALTSGWRDKPNLKTVLWLLDAGTPVDTRNDSEETALLVATGCQRSDVVKLLIERGADITSRDHRGLTPLAKCLDDYDTDERTLEMVRTLIELGADVNDSLGHAGGLAHENLTKSIEIFDLLVERGLDVNLPDEDGNLLLSDTIYHDKPELTKRLLDAGARVDAANSEGSTALHQAALAGKVSNARLLVSSGARVAQLDKSGKTSLHLALTKEDSHMISYLTEQWIDQGCFDSAKELLYMALEKGLFWCSRMMCHANNPEKDNMDHLEELYSMAIKGTSNGFPAFVRERGDDTDQMWLTGLFRTAIRLQHGDLLHALVDHKLDVNERDLLGEFPLHIAAEVGSEDSVSFLLDSGAELDMQDRRGNTSLLLAASAERVGVLKKLIERGANVSHTNHDGSTALHLTYKLETTQVLISAGVGINVLDNKLRTPLHRHVSIGSGPDIAQCLLDAGANVNLKDLDGDSPLHSACVYEETMLRLMLKYHPDMSLTDRAGMTPLQVARSWNDTTSAKIIEEYLASS